ncbi:MAG TPA: hypothetical protein VLS93_02545 [Anaeromyxobacteraceae bacterium]|nr:hypothetical protein [Anaeromyxobacteraceae bacterium]
MRKRRPGAEGETLERLAVDEAALEGRITRARREAAAIVEGARQEAERIAADARAEAEADRVRLRGAALAELERELACERAGIARAVADLPRRAEENRERAVLRAVEVVLGRGR